MQEKEIISVVIPVKNRHELLVETLDSVVNQKLPKGVSLQILVIDNLSSPPISSKIKKQFPSVVFLTYNTSASPSGTRNVGIKRALGKYIAFLDSDDLWKTNFIKKTYKILRNSDSSGITCIPEPLYQLNTGIISDIKIHFFNLIKKIFLYLYYILNNHQLPKSAFYLCQLSHTLFRFSPEVKFDEKIFNTEDWDFVIKMTKDKKLIIHPEKLIFYRYHPKNTALSQKVKKIKNKCYANLIKNLPLSHRVGFPYWFFKIYAKLFLIK